MRVQRGKKFTRIFTMVLVISLWLWLCLLNITWASYLSVETETEYKETIYVNVFFGFPSREELLLVKNIAIVFENMTNVPVNTTLKAFSELIKLKFDFVSAGDKAFVTFNIYFASSVNNLTACYYANDIIKNFLIAFEYHNLDLLWENNGLREGMMWVHKSFGYIPYTIETVSKFLRYKPTEGFARFINGFLESYMLTRGLLPSYTLEKIGQNFYWTIEILGTKNEQLKPNVRNHLITINVKEMLNTSSRLIEESSENQRVIIAIEKNRTLEINQKHVTYTIDIKNISPEGFIIGSSGRWLNTVEIRYEPVFPMENIIVEVVINSWAPAQFTWEEVVIISTFIALIALCVIGFIRKRRNVKGGEKV